MTQPLQVPVLLILVLGVYYLSVWSTLGPPRAQVQLSNAESQAAGAKGAEQG